MDLADLFPTWQLEARCLGLGNEAWFSNRAEGQGNHGTAAKKVCAACPVAATCLDAALEASDEWGIWGGAGEAERRIFAHCRPDRPHGPEPVADCACQWCFEWERHAGNLVAIARDRWAEIRPGDRNGKGATHGRRATYARGCRCPSCAWSASALGVLLARLGQSTAEWWERADGPHGDEETARRLDVAVVELVVGAVATLVALAGVGRGDVLAGIDEWTRSRGANAGRARMASWLAEQSAAEVLAEAARTPAASGADGGDSGIVGVVSPPDSPEYRTVAEVAAQLRVAPRHVRHLVEIGELPGVHVSPRVLRIPTNAVDEFVDRKAA